MPGGTSTPGGRVKTPVRAKVYAIIVGKVDLETNEATDAGVIIGNISNPTLFGSLYLLIILE